MPTQNNRVYMNILFNNWKITKYFDSYPKSKLNCKLNIMKSYRIRPQIFEITLSQPFSFGRKAHIDNSFEYYLLTIIGNFSWFQEFV